MSGIRSSVKAALENPGLLTWTFKRKNCMGLKNQVMEIKLIQKSLIKESMKNSKWPYNINSNCEHIGN